MELLAALVVWLLPFATAQFTPPAVVLQAGYPAGFRAFIPDFPGCEQFSFHGRVNSPFLGDDDLGTFHQNVLRPRGGFWTFTDLSIVLTPGDIIQFWTTVVKNKTSYTKRNQTWTVPEPDESIDLLSPVNLKPPTAVTGNPAKMVDTEPPPSDSTPTEITDTTPTSPDTTESSPPSTTPSTTSTTLSTTTPSTTTSTTPQTTLTTPLTTLTTTTKKPTTTESPKSAKTKQSTTPDPTMAEVEELTTPPPPEKPISSEFPEEPPPLFPFPSIFPRPFSKPIMPNPGTNFEICSNPWNFQERLGETRVERLERQMAKMQCELAAIQRSETQQTQTVESELSDLKKLIYAMVSRMSRLESVVRAAAYG